MGRLSQVDALRSPPFDNVDPLLRIDIDRTEQSNPTWPPQPPTGLPWAVPTAVPLHKTDSVGSEASSLLLTARGAVHSKRPIFTLYKLVAGTAQKGPCIPALRRPPKHNGSPPRRMSRPERASQ